MALTRKFKETIKARAESDVEFRRSLLIEAVNLFLEGEIDVAKSMLRDYINATVSFETVGKAVDKNPKSIQRMLGPSGNPSTRSLFEVIAFLQKKEKLHLKVDVA
ncbi:transcriptional regulator [Piscirickettsia litoralis]|uniref:Transcriptional regulator n=1 Tax=Piscirickettsia litoralis TaxID=1891921 RepID=A0ABX2ZXK3_9GAMM|nr:transcriptional regulator [Piscirickettsia litoralis]ODN41297.1 transcriptional regulator [Piscirickettsia litoralis]